MRTLVRPVTLVVRAQSSPAPPQRQQPAPLRRQAHVALAVEGPGSGRRRFPEPFETSPAAAAAPAAPAAAAAEAKTTATTAAAAGSHPCLSTADAYTSFQRVAGPPIDAERLAAAAAGPPLSAMVVAEVAGGPLSGRRVRPAPFDEDRGGDAPPPPRVPAAAGREESSEALLREVRARHGGC